MGNRPLVLLINPLQRYSQRNIWGKISKPGIPLGLGYLAAFLRQSDISVSVIDANLERLDADGLMTRLPQERPQIVGITAYTPGVSEAYGIARNCRKKYPDTPVVMGGVHASVLPKESLHSNLVDYVVRGEGEQAFLELVQGAEPSRIWGLSFRRGEEIVHNQDAPPIMDLDAIPFPAYDLLDPKLYGVTLGRARRNPAASILMSRGCPFSCHFCQAGQRPNPFRSRSAENVLSEIQWLKNHFEVREFAFQDDVMTSNRSRLIQFCELLLRYGMDISWSCLSRVDGVDRELLRLMKASGCHQIGFGIESGNEGILRQNGKNTTLAMSQEAVGVAREAGLEVVTYFILGLPGETRETLMETLRFSRSLRPDYCLFNLAIPFPGTRMFENAKQNGLLKTTDWTHYNGSEVILRSSELTVSELQGSYRKAYLEFYLSPGFLVSQIKKIRSIDELMTRARIALGLIRS